MNTFNSQSSLKAGSAEFDYFSLEQAEKAGAGLVSRLPFSLKVMLENLLRFEDGVTVLPEDQWPHTAATLGSNSCHIQAAVDVAAGRVVVVAAIDNLGKGAAGQALQNANLALGLDETLGLRLSGVLV